jgi:hypothetical protein
MPIVTDKNTGYGPLLVSQKYAPLLNIELSIKEKNYYGAILTNRFNLIRSQSLTSSLILVTSDWSASALAEAGKSPPLIVISSNRSNWIKSGIDALDEQLEYFGVDAFQNVSDLDALTSALIPLRPVSM